MNELFSIISMPFQQTDDATNLKIMSLIKKWAHDLLVAARLFALGLGTARAIFTHSFKGIMTSFLSMRYS